MALRVSLLPSPQRIDMTFFPENPQQQPKANMAVSCLDSKKRKMFHEKNVINNIKTRKAKALESF